MIHSYFIWWAVSLTVQITTPNSLDGCTATRLLISHFVVRRSWRCLLLKRMMGLRLAKLVTGIPSIEVKDTKWLEQAFETVQ